MNKKKGFAFIETIITVVILSTSLLYLYNSYSAIISDEEVRLYYDDVAYIYKTNYVRKFLEEHTDIENIKKYAFENSYIVTIGTGFESMFNENQRNDGAIASLENIVQSYNINQMLLIKTKMFDECYEDSLICKTSTENIGYNLKTYVNTLNDTSYDYYLVVEYAERVDSDNVIKCTPGTDKRCVAYYTSLGM